jgi:hypothetical protein
MLEIFLWGGGALAISFLFYLFKNGSRNNDPLNRKCAAEICDYLTSAEIPSPDEIRDIFIKNARYKVQANHVLSMVPPLLINAGMPKHVAMSVVPLLRSAVSLVPE